MDLSVVFGTWNRRELLTQCLASVRASLGALAYGGLAYEIVVIDAGSTDGSRELLLEQAERFGDVKPIFEAERRGATRAYNEAYALSSAPFVQLLNDDIEVVGDALALAYTRIKARPEVGQIALGYRTTEQREFRTYTIHGRVYANYAMCRREATDQVVEIQGGIWNPRYHTYAGDTELSCWLHKLGWVVEAADDLHLIDHFAQDQLRAENNSGRNRLDSMAFGRKWPSARHLEPDGPLPLATHEELEAFKRIAARRRPA